MLTQILFLFLGIIIGVVASYYINKYRNESLKGIPQSEVDKLNLQISEIMNEKNRLEERKNIFEAKNSEITLELSSERKKVLDLNTELSALKSNYLNLQSKLEEQKSEIEDIQKKFTDSFENLATRIMEEKSTKFTEQNKTNIFEILNPLNEKIKDFEKKVQETYDRESKERFSLERELRNLMELNKKMSVEANNLTNALKGQSKTQGNWGEIVLETILDKSGLVKGREYKIQESLINEDGKRSQPDVIIDLPENKKIIIDSKVSLTAYEKYCSTDNENEKSVFLDQHITSIRKHIKELSPKNYQDLYGINSLDFVLMFVPVEPAFSLAIQKDWSLLNEAYEKRIVMISTSTLLVTLRTISNLWRQENQNKNSLEIARQAGAMYDKFVGFTEDLVELGRKIQTAQKFYEDAMNKFSKGTGNLVKRAQNIKELGAQTTKSLAQGLLDKS
jgi:DNA recombination protein RmuC